MVCKIIIMINDKLFYSITITKITIIIIVCILKRILFYEFHFSCFYPKNSIDKMIS